MTEMVRAYGGYVMSIRRLYDDHKEVIWGRAGGYDLFPMY